MIAGTDYIHSEVTGICSHFLIAHHITHISLLFIRSSAHIFWNLSSEIVQLLWFHHLRTPFPSLVELTMTFFLPFSGVQLGYTVIFGWYAAFLFIRTGPTNSLFVIENRKLRIYLFRLYCWFVAIAYTFLVLLFQLALIFLAFFLKMLGLFAVGPSSCCIKC